MKKYFYFEEKTNLVCPLNLCLINCFMSISFFYENWLFTEHLNQERAVIFAKELQMDL